MDFKAGAKSPSVSVWTIQYTIINTDLRLEGLLMYHCWLHDTMLYASSGPANTDITVGDWKHIAWSDKSCFQLYQVGGCTGIKRTSSIHEAYNIALQSGGDSVMVWGVCS